MNSWGFLQYFFLSMCSELCLDDFSLRLLLALYLCLCVYMCSSLVFQDKFLFLAFCRGIKATRDHGYAVYSNSLWLADECDCVCLPQQNCGQKVWDAWNSGDSVRPIWPNTTSISALLISTPRVGRKMCKIALKSILSETQIEHEYKLLHISRRYLLNLSCNEKPSSSVFIITRDSLQSSTWHGVFRAFNHFQLCSLTCLWKCSL